MAAKKKYSGMTILQKLNAIRAVDTKMKTKSAVAKELGIPRSTLSTYLKNRHSIEKQAAQGANISVRKRMRGGKHANLEIELSEWLCQARNQMIPITATLIRDKAREIASKLNISFQCSNGWLHRFQHRHNIGLRSKSSAARNRRESDKIPIFNPDLASESGSFSLFEGSSSGSQPGESGPPENSSPTNGSSRPLPLALYSSDQSPEKKRLKLEVYPDVEDCLLMWYIQTSKQNLPITGQLLQEQASEFARLLGHDNLHFSDAWLNKFKSRKGIALKKHREDFLALPPPTSNSNTTEGPHAKQFDVTSSYPKKDIFIVFETGLLLKLLPDEKPEEWSSKIIRAADGDFAEERLTLILACNMDGTEKLPLVVIGSSEDGNQLSEALAAIEYVRNQSSWITCDIVENWVFRLERRMKKYGRKIVLVTENGLFGAVSPKLRNVQIFVRPPHSLRYVTLQSGRIITSLKLRYRQNLLSQTLKHCMAGEDSLIRLTDSLCWLASAWLEMKPDAFISGDSLGAHVDGEQEMFEECQRMILQFCMQKGNTNEVGNISADSYVRVDDHMCTMSNFLPHEIAAIFQKYNSPSRAATCFGEENLGENISMQSIYTEENSRSYCNSNTTSFSEDGRLEISDEIIVPNIESAMADPALIGSEHFRDTPGSVTSDGEDGVKLSFVVEFPRTQQTDDDPASNRELPSHQMATISETTAESHHATSANFQAYSEHSTIQASDNGNDDCTYPQNVFNCSSSVHPNTKDGISRCTSTTPLENAPPHSCTSLPCIHLSSNREMCVRSNVPTAGEAMTALMLVHSFMLSRPSVNSIVTDSFSHLVRFLSDAVVEESQKKSG